MKRKILFPMLALGIFLLAAFPAGCADRPPTEWNIENPYASVDWTQYQQHKANLHTHTTASDGRGTPAEVIDGYRALGYTVLALTDHDTLHTDRTTWPWQDFERNPETLGMIAIEGNEISRLHHTGSYFNDYGGPNIESEAEAVQEIGRRGGLAVLFHPGRYKKTVEWYLDIYRSHPHLIGLEIYNQGDRYPKDRETWDAILTGIISERPVWGFSNDDMHNPERHLGRNWNILLLPELSLASVRRSMEKGMFFFVYAPEGHNGATPPTIRSITVDAQKGVIEINADGHEIIEWISQGAVVHQGPRANLPQLPQAQGYIRAIVRAANEGPVVGTQPFRIRPPAK